jgi:hypothetical protein
MHEAHSFRSTTDTSNPAFIFQRLGLCDAVIVSSNGSLCHSDSAWPSNVRLLFLRGHSCLKIKSPAEYKLVHHRRPFRFLVLCLRFDSRTCFSSGSRPRHSAHISSVNTPVPSCTKSPSSGEDLFYWGPYKELTSITGQPTSKLKLYYDRESVGQSVSVSGTHLGPATNISFYLKFDLDSCGCVIL